MFKYYLGLLKQIKYNKNIIINNSSNQNLIIALIISIFIIPMMLKTYIAHNSKKISY
jgi:hypothetical protein